MHDLVRPHILLNTNSDQLLDTVSSDGLLLSNSWVGWLV